MGLFARCSYPCHKSFSVNVGKHEQTCHSLHGRVFEKAVIRIEHFFAKVKEPLPRQPTIIKARLSIEFDP